MVAIPSTIRRGLQTSSAQLINARRPRYAYSPNRDVTILNDELRSAINARTPVAVSSSLIPRSMPNGDVLPQPTSQHQGYVGSGQVSLVINSTH